MKSQKLPIFQMNKLKAPGRWNKIAQDPQGWKESAVS